MSNNYSLLTGLKKLNHKKPDHLWADSNKQHLLTYLSENTGAQSSGPVFYFNLRPAIATFVLLGVVCFTGVSTIFAAKNSLPGQPLYTVKRLTEQVRLAMTTNQNQKNVLRAELITTRVEEVKVLARQIQGGADGNAEKNLVAAVTNIKSDISTLKNELNANSPVDDNVKQVEQGSLPIQDGKTMAGLILSSDVQKSLDETKASLVKKDLNTALTKAGEITDKISAVSGQVDATDPTVTGDNSTSTPVINQLDTVIIPTVPVVKPSEKPVNTNNSLIKPVDEVKIDIVKENTFNGDVIFEK
ncbi:MAG: DUF5667 domain-containing protein [Patescibacteria group bacterium]|nr:DUF5667 domain-containing protein [Patescibacteria group bacterium]MDD5121360.1 DUF5667 domain-containing protein [Patescibacteria group bacterium]MDD5222072.1 DUF5667 domain-containing protein [Patescibacteria group bacterium]MDD5395721.1 DUF5667 domain-containing protein [Patescibacteria group bacterium]